MAVEISGESSDTSVFSLITLGNRKLLWISILVVLPNYFMQDFGVWMNPRRLFSRSAEIFYPPWVVEGFESYFGIYLGLVFIAFDFRLKSNPPNGLLVVFFFSNLTEAIGAFCFTLSSIPDEWTVVLCYALSCRLKGFWSRSTSGAWLKLLEIAGFDDLVLDYLREDSMNNSMSRCREMFFTCGLIIACFDFFISVSLFCTI